MFSEDLKKEDDVLYHLVVGALNSNEGSVFGAAIDLRTSRENLNKVIIQYDLRYMVSYDK